MASGSGGHHEAALQEKLGQGHLGTGGAGLPLREGEGGVLKSHSDALALQLHHALLQGPQGGQVPGRVWGGRQPGRLFLCADAPCKARGKGPGALGVYAHLIGVEAAAHQPRAVGEAEVDGRPHKIGLTVGALSHGEGVQLQAVFPLQGQPEEPPGQLAL